MASPDLQLFYGYRYVQYCWFGSIQALKKNGNLHCFKSIPNNLYDVEFILGESRHGKYYLAFKYRFHLWSSIYIFIYINDGYITYLIGYLAPRKAPTAHLRLCLHSVLFAAEEFLATFAIKCSSWSAVNRGTSCRTPCTSLGFEDYPSVSSSNQMAGRLLGFSRSRFICSTTYRFGYFSGDRYFNPSNKGVVIYSSPNQIVDII